VTGNYGSEVLRGVSAFKAVPLCKKLFYPDFYKYIQKSVKTFTDLSKDHRLSFTVFKQAPWQGYGRLCIEQSQVTLRTPYMDYDLVCLVYQAPAEAIANAEFSLRLVSNGNSDLCKILTDRGLGWNSNNLFSKASHLYYEFLFKMEYLYNYGMPQWMAKLDNVFVPLHLKRFFLGRHKFHHFRIWFHNELADYVRKILLDKRAGDRPYLNKNFLEKMVNSHIKGTHNFTNEINKILTAELIHRILIENI
jgi:asparagine synthase (glutamine-hydrolysing)